MPKNDRGLMKLYTLVNISCNSKEFLMQHGNDVFKDIIRFLVIWRVWKFLASGVCSDTLKAFRSLVHILVLWKVVVFVVLKQKLLDQFAFVIHSNLHETREFFQESCLAASASIRIPGVLRWTAIEIVLQVSSAWSWADPLSSQT